jgi:type II secretory pathway predicted ATPase ExeA
LRLLSREELIEYVQHRCTIAGSKKLPFDTAALEALHEISRGNLRAADALALTALERAALSKKSVVGAQHIAEARQDLYP